MKPIGYLTVSKSQFIWIIKIKIKDLINIDSQIDEIEFNEDKYAKENGINKRTTIDKIKKNIFFILTYT